MENILDAQDLLLLSFTATGLLLMFDKHPSFGKSINGKTLPLKKLSEFTIKDMMATAFLFPSVALVLVTANLLDLSRKITSKSRLMNFLNTKPFAKKAD